MGDKNRGRSKSKKRRGAKRSPATIVWLVAALVVIAIAGMFLFKGSGKSSGASTSPTNPASGSASGGGISAAVIGDITDVPAATLAAAGAGGSEIRVPAKLPASTAALTANGKPEIVYVGAEYCPYCAGERWPLVQALTRFGTFSNLSPTTSGAAPEAYPDTPTFTFVGSTFTSSYITFTPVEIADRTGQPLQQMTADQQQLLKVYDAPPYVPASSKNAIPFLDIGGVYLQTGSAFGVELLQGMSLEQIAGSLASSSSKTGQAIDASANLMTAAICEVTSGQPAAVCTAPGVVAATQRLATGK